MSPKLVLLPELKVDSCTSRHTHKKVHYRILKVTQKMAVNVMATLGKVSEDSKHITTNFL